jgi:hypothetical protein
VKRKFIASVAATALVMIAAGGLVNPAYGSDDPAPGTAGLQKFAKLPAQTFVSGSEPSGSLLGTAPINGVTPPFADQPVQGFSGVLRKGDGSFEILSDNGYGNKANSADFILRIQRVFPDFGTGAVDVVGGINLTDPNRQIPFPLTRPDRVLTGSDLDPESIVRLPDGTYWIGDEFGPFLLHFDRAGRLLSPPVSLPGVFAPENPFRGTTPANLGSSRGFESLAVSPDKRTLYALLEGTVTGDAVGSLRLDEFDLQTGAYTGKTWRYQRESPAKSVADAAMVNEHQMLVIERDDTQGDAAVFKRIYLVDLRDSNGDGLLDRTPVADLLNIANPYGVGGFGDPFRFPFFTIESVLILDDRTLLVANDNNFPMSAGRTPGRPDDNEIIVIRLGTKLNLDCRVLT